MLDPARRQQLQYRVVLVVLVATVLVLTVAGIRLAHTDTNTNTSASPHPDAPDTPTVDPRGASLDTGTTLPPLTGQDEPETFARAVAHALFDWDTTASTDPAKHVGRLVAVADPTGESTPGLVADITAYLPTPETWDMLRQYSTRQWITITSIDVPTLWSQALTEAGQDRLPPGTSAFTITGKRHRAGEWEGELVSIERDVAFTVFFVCEPAYPDCHLLRLSRLNEPLP